MSVFPLKRPELKDRKKVIIACGDKHTVGLKSDGTVVATGNNVDGQCNVSGWNNIVAVACGCNNYRTVGLKSDGTVVAVGYNDDGRGNVSGWNNIVAISCGGSHTVGLKSDGTVVATGRNVDGQCNVSGWNNIVAVACDNYRTVGLKSDGTVVTTRDYNVSGWNNIVAISCGRYHTVGLKSDGTVVATGNNGDGQCNVSGWNNIVAAVACGNYHTVGLKSDGTVVAVGNNADGQCNVSGWNNIVAISCGGSHTVGLKSDGTVVATGNNGDGQCNVTSWLLVRYDKKGLLIAKMPINLLDKTKVKGFTFEGIQPTNTDRKVAFKVDDKWNKLTADGALSPLSTQEITADSVLAEGNTAAELTALTNVPSLAGKLVYPAIALYASEKATAMPTFGLKVNTITDRNKNSITSPVYHISDTEITITDITVNKKIVGNAGINIFASIKNSNGWSFYTDIDNIINKKATDIKFIYTFYVKECNGENSAHLIDIAINYDQDNQTATLSGNFKISPLILCINEKKNGLTHYKFDYVEKNNNSINSVRRCFARKLYKVSSDSNTVNNKELVIKQQGTCYQF